MEYLKYPPLIVSEYYLHFVLYVTIIDILKNHRNKFRIITINGKIGE